MPALVYQVFVDRFAAGGPIPATPARAAAEGLERRAWEAAPVEPAHNRDLYGGDLDGVVRRLDHIVGLGADAIYLTPIFRAPSNHKYDTADYDVVDEHFGGDAAFARLVTAAHARGLQLFLDGVFNHVGDRHAWWRERRPGWFRPTFWRGYDHLPELDLGAPAVQQALFGDDGVIARWSRRGVDGWRLDCANDLGPRGCALARAAARRAGATAGTIGELMVYPAGWTGEALDGVMNYWVRSAALGLAAGRLGSDQAQGALDRLARDMDPIGLQNSWTMLSSHDTPRLATALDDQPDRVRQALVLAFAYPGVPLIYYGEEIGMRGGADPANRGGMVWDERAWDGARLALIRQLAELRRTHPALRGGAYQSCAQPGSGMVVFARTTSRPEDTLIFVGSDGEAREGLLLLPLAHLHDGLTMRDLLSGEDVGTMRQGCLAVKLPPAGALLLTPHDRDPSGYRFLRDEERGSAGRTS